MGLLGQLLGLDGGGLFGGQQQGGSNLGSLFSGLMKKDPNALPAGHVPGSIPPPAKGDGSLSYAQLAQAAAPAPQSQGYQTRHMREGGGRDHTTAARLTKKQLKNKMQGNS